MVAKTVGLVVPINVEALCVNEQAAHLQGENPFGEAMSNFALLPYFYANSVVNKKPNLGSELVPSPFGSQSLGTGVHLHWALPQALSQTKSGADSSTSLWPVPNRWLVCRTVVQDYADPSSLKVNQQTWILESDRLNTNPPNGLFSDQLIQPSLAVPFHSQVFTSEEAAAPFRYMGQGFESSKWQESLSDRFYPLTSVGYGESQYAAFYPNCQNVFGFFDSEASISASPQGRAFDDTTDSLSYVVMAWYSSQGFENAPKGTNLQFDPLVTHPITSGTDNIFKWAYQGSTNPSYTILSGMVQNIPWNPTTRYWNDSTTDVDIVMGNNPIEALSAWVANNDSLADKEANVEAILNALQLGKITELPQADGLIELAEKVHQSGFGTRRGGILWQVVKRPVVGDTPSAQIPENYSYWQQMDNQEVTLPDAVAEALNTLNTSQLQLDALQDSIESSQIQIFGDWAKYMKLAYYEDQPPPTSLNSNQMMNFVQCELADLANLQSQADASNAQSIAASVQSHLTTLKSLLSHLNEELKKQQPTDKNTPIWQYVLEQIPASPFWQANNPTLLFHGDDVAPGARFGSQDDLTPTGYLPCRTTDQLITTLTLQDSNLSSQSFPVSIPGSDALQNSHNLPHSKVFQALYAEAILLNPNNNNMVANILKSLGGAGNPAINQYDAVASIFQTAQKQLTTTSPYTDTEVGINGEQPSLLEITQWNGTPWIPLQLQWEVQFDPFAYLPNDSQTIPPNYDSKFLVETFRFSGPDGSDAVDNIPVFNTPAPTQFQTYYHSTLLSPAASQNLYQQIQNYLDAVQSNSDLDMGSIPLSEIIADLKDLQNQVKNLPILSQAIGGWNEGLVMQNLVLQLAVSEPGAFPGGFTSQVAAAVGTESSVLPVAGDSYNPIRAGLLKVKQLWLLDTFGRIKEITVDASKVQVTQSLRPQNLDAVPQGSAYLPPRITQPSRLEFRFLTSDHDVVEANNHPAASPIVGWVIPNHLDDSLMVYASDGTAIATLQPSAQGSVLVLAAPNNPHQGTTVATVFQGQNPHLVHMAMGLVSSKAYFQDFLNAVNAVSDTVLTPSAATQQLATLVGRPLALVRTALKLELQGQPRTNQSWEVLKDLVPAHQDPHTQTPVPLRSDSEFTQVEFPVQLGNLSKLNDGLVGYFLVQSLDDAQDYETFYTFQSGGSGQVKLAQRDTVTLTCGPEADPHYLSLLIDPTAPVHATTGILPVKTIQVPSDQYAAALQKMQMMFLATPAVSPVESFTYPTPREPGFQWSFYTQTPPSGEQVHWNEARSVTSPSSKATLSYAPQQISDGWLVLTPQPSKSK